VIVSIAILTAIAVDLAYSTRVSLLTAANARDELRAEYLARGAVQLSRLILKFQSQLDGAGSSAAAAAGAAAGAGGAAAAVAAAAGGAMRVQVWNLVPITSALTDGIFGAGEPGGGPSATFEAKIEDEGRKVSAQMDAAETAGAPGGGTLGVQLEAFLMMVADPRWDPLFDREDANGLRVTRTDVAVYLHDWTDSGSIGSAITNNPAKPFEDGFGDENQPYSRGDEPYKTKNQRFDSLDELYLVAGIDDAFMDAFRSQLTVYPDKNKLMNVNTDDPDEMVRNASVIVEPTERTRLQVPDVRAALVLKVREARQMGFVVITPTQFTQVVSDLGFRLVPNAAALFTDRSLVYRIRASGAAGATERRVDAVFSFDTGQCNGAPADFGCPLHWREE
jgi:general secretion pathway protein K